MRITKKQEYGVWGVMFVVLALTGDWVFLGGYVLIFVLVCVFGD